MMGQDALVAEGAGSPADPAASATPVTPAEPGNPMRPAIVPTGVVDSSFASCYQDLHPEMVRLAALLTGSRETAQDLVQDAFVRLHGAWSRVREPRPYLRRAVVNACHSHHRRRRVERRHAAQAEPVAPALAEPDELADALAALPHRQRAAIVLRFYADLPDADIAAALGCRPGTVASLIHRGLEQLRRVIER
jgi:RNA polymerase sigma-70 factor (sigma-E family)